MRLQCTGKTTVLHSLLAKSLHASMEIIMDATIASVAVYVFVQVSYANLGEEWCSS